MFLSSSASSCKTRPLNPLTSLNFLNAYPLTPHQSPHSPTQTYDSPLHSTRQYPSTAPFPSTCSRPPTDSPDLQHASILNPPHFQLFGCHMFPSSNTPSLHHSPTQPTQFCHAFHTLRNLSQQSQKIRHKQVTRSIYG